jgi:hypothetical protein
MPDHLLGGLGPEARDAVLAHLVGCAACRDEAEGLSETWARLGVRSEARPSPALRAGFYAMLEAYPRDAEDTSPRVARPRRAWARLPFVLQAAAAVLVLAAGFALGRWARGPVSGPVSAGPGPVGGPVADASPAPLSLLHRPSAGDRLQGVALAAEVAAPDDALVSALLDAVDGDPNVNVRLRAVESLFLFSHQPDVRARLVESLGRQSSPVVQIALIDLLAASREKQAAEALRRLIKDRAVRMEVRQHARARLERLL